MLPVAAKAIVVQPARQISRYAQLAQRPSSRLESKAVLYEKLSGSDQSRASGVLLTLPTTKPLGCEGHPFTSPLAQIATMRHPARQPTQKVRRGRVELRSRRSERP